MRESFRNLIRSLNDLIRIFNESVPKQRCEQILNIVEDQRLGIELPARFNRERDVDWQLLKPYIDTKK